MGLLEVIKVISDFIFNGYNLNITKYLTLPSLAKNIYGTNYHKEEHQIKMIRGPLEKFIRSAYKGGDK